MRLSLVSLVLAAALGVPAVARANPRPLPMSYTADTLPEGKLELEPAVDYTPVRVRNSNGDLVWYGASTLQLELEYGLTDSVELGLYMTVAANPSEYSDVPRMPAGTGLKQRVRWRLTDPGAAFGAALYGEVSENEREIELEAKLILQANLGHGLRLVTNLWGEREYYLDGASEWVLNPTLAAVYQATPAIHPGLEAWMRSEYPDDAPATRGFVLGPHVYVGPTIMFDFGKLWVNTGVYLRATDLDRKQQDGEGFGHIWVRFMCGISFD
jgi:hypothetical protein